MSPTGQRNKVEHTSTDTTGQNPSTSPKLAFHRTGNANADDQLLFSIRVDENCLQFGSSHSRLGSFHTCPAPACPLGRDNATSRPPLTMHRHWTGRPTPFHTPTPPHHTIQYNTTQRALHAGRIVGRAHIPHHSHDTQWQVSFGGGGGARGRWAPPPPQPGPDWAGHTHTHTHTHKCRHNTMGQHMHDRSSGVLTQQAHEVTWWLVRWSRPAWRVQ